jgi:hypothetical protein
MPIENPKDSNTKIFRQHGFLQKGSSGVNQVHGRCIFCGHDNNFYINTQSKAWDCKSCGKHGGFKTLLKEIAGHFQQFFAGNEAINLSKERGISIATLRAFHLGYNPLTKNFLVPVMEPNGLDFLDVKIYTDGRLHIGAGCHVGLFNWQTLEKSTQKEVWLCEGEWDGMVMHEICRAMNSKAIVVAVPGANTFKADWAGMFTGKDVKVLYDCDQAGTEGSKKVYATLQSVARSLKFLHWPEGLRDGFDLRDLYKERGRSPKVVVEYISKKLKSNPPNTKEILAGEEAKPESQYEGVGVSPATVYEAYRRWLFLENTSVLDILFGTIIANRWPGEPLWLMLVAPSGGVKTELIVTFDRAPNIMTISNITPHTLVSGANFAGSGDPSLVPKLDGKVLMIKDLTPLLTKNEIQRDEITGDLRDVYDGSIVKRFGNGVVRAYQSKFGIIAGVTPVVELYTEQNTSFGERFIRFNVPISDALVDQRSIAKRALLNTGSEMEMREQLKVVAEQALNYDFGSPPKVETVLEDKITALAQWTSLMRATFNRDKYTRETTHKPYAELPTRLSKQFYKTVQGVAAFRRKPVAGLSEYEIVKDVALSTVPSRMESLIRKFMQDKTRRVYDLKTISSMAGLPTMTVSRVVENLILIRVLKRSSKLLIPEYHLTDDILQIMSIAGLYQ